MKDTTAAIKFLMKWRPNGPWQLTAINKDEGKIISKMFHVRDAIDALPKWIDSFQGRFNIYFTVNPLIEDKDKKALKTDMKEMSWLHVDIDARAGEDPAAEVTRIVKLLEEYTPAPTAIVLSGGGVQGFWKLDEPLPVDGDVTKAEAAELYNKAIEQALGGDACHNVDRVMRLPGTINVPDAGKRKKGRVPAPATLHSFDVKRVYSISDFKPAAAPAAAVEESTAPAAGAKITPVKMDPSKAQTRTTIDDIPDLPDWLRATIRDGEDGANEFGKKYGSRSEALYAAVCGMARHGVSPETALTIITSPAFKVSEYVFETSGGKKRVGRELTRYAERQINRGYEAAHDPHVFAMNEEHAVVCLETKVRVLKWVPSQIHDNVKVPAFFSAEDLALLYKNKTVAVTINGDTKRIPLVQYWLAHPSRRTYQGIVFAPGIDDDEVNGCLNLWSGWGVHPAQGDWSLMRNHIRDNLAAGNEEYDRYIMKWLAWSVQNPDKPAGVVLVLRGKKGTGKSTLGTVMCRLFGPSGIHVSSRDDLVGKFNNHFMRCSMLFADEALWPGHKSDDGPLKRIITEPTLTIEPKGIDKFTVANHLHIIMVGNDEWLVPASEDERRYAVFQVSDEYQYSKNPEKNKAYFTPIYKQLEKGGMEAMLYDLMHMPLGDWTPRDDVPNTEALREQKLRTLSPEDQWIAQLLENAYLPGAYTDSPDTASSAALHSHARINVPTLRNMSATRLDEMLIPYAKRGRNKATNLKTFKFRPLATLRKEWAERYGGWEFDEETTWGATSAEPMGTAEIPF